jgi:hypothetical protein
MFDRLPLLPRCCAYALAKTLSKRIKPLLQRWYTLAPLWELLKSERSAHKVVYRGYLVAQSGKLNLTP